MAADPGRATIVTTEFGTVTDKQIKYYYKKGWFSGGAEEDIPLRHITSIRLETERSLVWGILCLLIGLMFLGADGAAKVAALIPLALAVLLFWGSPKVVVNTAGGDLRPASGFPWTKSEAERFVQALRVQLFKE